MKKRDSSAPHADYWLSLSDLLSVLVFIFITALVAFSLVFQKEKIAYETIQTDLMKAPLSLDIILKQIHQDLLENGIKSEIITHEGILRLPDEAIAFPMAKAYPDLEYRKNIAKISKILSRRINCHAKVAQPGISSGIIEDSKDHCAAQVQDPGEICQNHYGTNIESIMIEGHTDSVPLKPGVGYFDNLTLSAARASTVFRMMRRCSPELDDFMNDSGKTVFGVAGYSSSRPAFPEDPRDPRNRRIDIRIVMESYDVKKLDQSVLSKYLPQQLKQRHF